MGVLKRTSGSLNFNAKAQNHEGKQKREKPFKNLAQPNFKKFSSSRLRVFALSSPVRLSPDEKAK